MGQISVSHGKIPPLVPRRAEPSHLRNSRMRTDFLPRLIHCSQIGCPRARGLCRKAAICALLTPLAPVGSYAAADRATSCILRATEALPKVAGLRIKRSATRPMPANQLANWKGQSIPVMVDIDAEAPDASLRYSFVCASSANGATFVQRVLPDR